MDNDFKLYMKAVIISVGDELVMGQTVDSNSAWLSARLSEQGVMTLYHKTVADDLEATALAMGEALQAAGLVILTGGLGPTPDDLTRQAMAKLIDQPLVLHQPSLEKILKFFEKMGREMPPVNRVQAMCPQGGEMLDNDCGTAPGLKIVQGKSVLYAFPGVPREMKEMYRRYVVPSLQQGRAVSILTEKINTFGMGEGMVAERLGDLMRRDRMPVVGTTVSDGIVAVRIRSEFATKEESKRQLDLTIQEVRARLGDVVFGTGSETLSEVVGRMAVKKGKKLATAESCTGGLVANLITDVAGSSRYFIGGWITYSNEAKSRELGVPADLILEHGAVSGPVAESMARGALERSGGDLAVSLTGIAGPDGGSEDKPVGTVWIAVAERKGNGIAVKAECFRFPGDRSMVRNWAARTALNMLRDLLVKS